MGENSSDLEIVSIAIHLPIKLVKFNMNKKDL